MGTEEQTRVYDYYGVPTMDILYYRGPETDFVFLVQGNGTCGLTKPVSAVQADNNPRFRTTI